MKQHRAWILMKRFLNPIRLNSIFFKTVKSRNVLNIKFYIRLKDSQSNQMLITLKVSRNHNVLESLTFNKFIEPTKGT